MFTKVGRSRVSAAIVAQIERAIFEGKLAPGDRLDSEQDLSAEFAVSRVTVRDAFRVLETRGLIRIKVGGSGGAFVTDASSERVAESISTMLRLRRMTVSELAEARRILEVAAAEWAAERADAVAVKRLARLVDSGRPLVRNAVNHADVGLEFHVELAVAARNEVLRATVAAYRELLLPSIRDLQDARTSDESQKAHEELLEAIRRHDSEAAGEIMTAHLANFEKRLRRRLGESRRRKKTARPKAKVSRARPAASC